MTRAQFILQALLFVAFEYLTETNSQRKMTAARTLAAIYQEVAL